MKERQLPSCEQSEKILLAAIMSEKNAITRIRELVTPEAFYSEKHREIYQAALDVSDRGDFPDLIILMQELSKRESKVTPYELTGILNSYTPMYEQHAALVFDKYKRRQFFEVGIYLQANCFSEEEDIVDVLDHASEKLDNMLSTNTDSISNMRNALEGVYDNINRNLSGATTLTGFPTGFRKFDERSGGLQTSDLIVIAADTSSGKTSLAIKIAMMAGCPIAFYSMEMKKEQIAARMTAIASGVSSNEILFYKLTSSQLQCVDRGVKKIADLPVFFDDRSTSNIESILASIRSMKSKYGIKGVIVDYLQVLNVNMKTANKEQQMGDVARRLKNIAKDLDIWVIALSQLNRDKLDPVPTLARLRDSGQIAEAADVVMLIYRPEIYGKQYPDPFLNASTKGTAMIDVAKGRNIGLMKFLVGFDSPTTNFHELEFVPTQKSDDPF